MKFLNFKIHTSIAIKAANQVFDLHNHFRLRGYQYDVTSQTFCVHLNSLVYYHDEVFEDAISTQLDLIFKGVKFLRIGERNPNIPIEVFAHENCLDSLEYPISYKFEHPLYVGLDTVDLAHYLLLDFIYGSSMLIAAETVEVRFEQHNRSHEAST